MSSTGKDELSEDAHNEFLRLFSRYSRRIYEFILTFVVRHADAEEIFQNTCLVLWKKFGLYDPEGNFCSWACRIAYLEMLKHRRNSQRLHLLNEEALALLAEKALTWSDNLEARREALEDCLQKLNPQDRGLIEQRYYERQSPKEIAEARGQSVHSVYRALARVHTMLMNCVQLRLARE